jgi:6-pyruvoyltetrahydropterin/6-carboxytetrahydropterin synthase
MISISRTHEIHCGHRLMNHNGKCKYLHGHNYIITFKVSVINANQLDETGMVVDTNVIENVLCKWLDDNLDHKFILCEHDTIIDNKLDKTLGIVRIPFNPTAENIARYLFEVAEKLLDKLDLKITSVTVKTTTNSQAIYTK